MAFSQLDPNPCPSFSAHYRVNIYFGLVAYNAKFTMIVAYIVYIVLLIVGIGVYHYRWSHEGKTVRGDSRILVKNFLMGEENEKGGKGDESKQPLLSLVGIWPIIKVESQCVRGY